MQALLTMPNPSKTPPPTCANGCGLRARRDSGLCWKCAGVPACANGCDRPGSRHNGLCWKCHDDPEIAHAFSPGTPRSRRPGRGQEFLERAQSPENLTEALPGSARKIRVMADRIGQKREACAADEGPRSLELAGVFRDGNTLAGSSFGYRLFLLRKDARLTQAGLARKSGVSRARINQYEQNREAPRNVGTFKRLALALGVATEVLVGDLLERG